MSATIQLIAFKISKLKKTKVQQQHLYVFVVNSKKTKKIKNKKLIPTTRMSFEVSEALIIALRLQFKRECYT